MTQKTKLEPIGPYTPEHEGPFCDKDGVPIELKIRDGRGATPLFGYRRKSEMLIGWDKNGDNPIFGRVMNAREVPVAREFWANEFKRADGYIGVSHAHETEIKAINERYELPHWNWTRTIHVREFLPGEGS
ncbi:hypothetical protein [Acetobacter okinawensis]|uniref:Uncharacterized protein n=1 Tax=Acetobacter okinawensis TaxID=1076594 RepID=A0A252BY43_9PROT|nr:hypothetical protein [Acetobacter okinawensis]OUJ13843.1 hypothetical protein HK26_04175 [Acetobacter okinawensis]